MKSKIFHAAVVLIAIGPVSANAVPIFDSARTGIDGLELWQGNQSSHAIPANFTAGVHKVEIEFINEDNQKVTLELEDLLARVFLHENDCRTRTGHHAAFGGRSDRSGRGHQEEVFKKSLKKLEG